MGSRLEQVAPPPPPKPTIPPGKIVREGDITKNLPEDVPTPVPERVPEPVPA